MPQNRLQILLGLFLLVPFFAATAQNSSPAAPPSCSAPQFRQLDFRVGEWDLTWPGSKPDEVQHGRNTIRKILDDCVIQEQFDGGAAAPLRGMSVSIYNPGLKEWQQTWVDNQAAYLDFTGEFAEGEMVLSRHARNAKGDDIVQRMGV
jgi:hypothetical protein